MPLHFESQLRHLTVFLAEVRALDELLLGLGWSFRGTLQRRTTSGVYNFFVIPFAVMHVVCTTQSLKQLVGYCLTYVQIWHDHNVNTMYTCGVYECIKVDVMRLVEGRIFEGGYESGSAGRNQSK